MQRIRDRQAKQLRLRRPQPRTVQCNECGFVSRSRSAREMLTVMADHGVHAHNNLIEFTYCNLALEKRRRS